MKYGGEDLGSRSASHLLWACSWSYTQQGRSGSFKTSAPALFLFALRIRLRMEGFRVNHLSALLLETKRAGGGHTIVLSV